MDKFTNAVDLVTNLTLRSASLGDLDVIVADVQAGFDSYIDFAPPGWQPRDVARDTEWITALLSADGTWAQLALVEERPVGHVSFFPARRRDPGDRRSFAELPQIPGLVHLWQLFVLPDWWGRGVAPTLHDAAVSEMTAQGFREARLYTPSAHARARRFYERRGWSPREETWNEELRLMLTECRRLLP